MPAPSMGDSSRNSSLHLAQSRKARRFEFASIKHVVGIKRDKSFAVRMRDMDAALLDAAHIECLRVDELNDEHTKQISVAEVLGDKNLREAAKQFAQRRRLRCG